MPDKKEERAPYEIAETPEGKFILRWGTAAQAGPFASRLEAETAMYRVIANVVYRYDAKGKSI